VIVALETPDLRANCNSCGSRGLQMSCESATARNKSDHSSLFLSACSTHRRDDAGAFAAPNRQAEGEVHGFTAGYRMTLGAAPSRFAPKMISAEWRALSVSLVPSAGPARERGRAWRANRQLCPRSETLPVLRNFRLRYGLPCEFESANDERVGVVRR
jgi:hypothetical protein